MANNIAENAPVRVRFKHAGIADEQGVHRPICQPNKIKFQTVKHEKDVTCPHCLEHISNFKGWMALQIAAGNVPEDELPLEDRVMALARRDMRISAQGVADELKVSVKETRSVLGKLFIAGRLTVEGLEYVLVA